MTLALRIIPCLDVQHGRVVKGVRFTGLRDAGDPVELAQRYFLEGADELTFLDISASTEDRGTTLDIVSRTAEKVFIPLTVGGGIRSVEDVDVLLRAGADKISVNTAAINRPQLLNEISERFGNQVLVLSVDAKRRPGTANSFEVTTHGGQRTTGIDALKWIAESIERGVGEILLNSMDMDGTTEGFDVLMLEAVRSICDVPIIASGGAGRLTDFTRAAESGADALLAASVFHFGHMTINDVKVELSNHGIVVRETRIHGAI
jgi:imidazole glycerol-phosphate synthase subunit HisF